MDLREERAWEGEKGKKKYCSEDIRQVRMLRSKKSIHPVSIFLACFALLCSFIPSPPLLPLLSTPLPLPSPLLSLPSLPPPLLPLLSTPLPLPSLLLSFFPPFPFLSLPSLPLSPPLSALLSPPPISPNPFNQLPNQEFTSSGNGKVIHPTTGSAITILVEQRSKEIIQASQSFQAGTWRRTRIDPGLPKSNAVIIYSVVVGKKGNSSSTACQGTSVDEGPSPTPKPPTNGFHSKLCQIWGCSVDQEIICFLQREKETLSSTAAELRADKSLCQNSAGEKYKKQKRKKKRVLENVEKDEIFFILLVTMISFFKNSSERRTFKTWKEKGDTVQWKSIICSKFFCIKRVSNKQMHGFLLESTFQIKSYENTLWVDVIEGREKHIQTVGGLQNNKPDQDNSMPQVNRSKRMRKDLIRLPMINSQHIEKISRPIWKQTKFHRGTEEGQRRVF
ncbi:hypothetical protein L345_01591, partial [Ophiophagus hannah]